MAHRNTRRAAWAALVGSTSVLLAVACGDSTSEDAPDDAGAADVVNSVDEAGAAPSPNDAGASMSDARDAESTDAPDDAASSAHQCVHVGQTFHVCETNTTKGYRLACDTHTCTITEYDFSADAGTVETCSCEVPADASTAACGLCESMLHDICPEDCLP